MTTKDSVEMHQTNNSPQIETESANVEISKNEREDQIVATLEQDMWALAYAIKVNRKKSGIPWSFVLLLIIVYFTQIMTLIMMSWSYYVMLNYDVELKYELDGNLKITTWKISLAVSIL